ncbi:MAG TPA: TetR family transcriptional regulator [Burkholderiales bacterium]|nr:TetR family transcriptional regulator [Burkholderiales bacterium]
MAPKTLSSADRTRERIIQAAERLFLEHGFDGTSLRLVTSLAGVNLGAVNYHFGGKDALFEAMLARRFDSLHAERLALLDAYQAEGRTPSCEQLLTALFKPALARAREADADCDFLRLLGRAYIDPSPVLRKLLAERYAPTIARFKEAFAAALPQLSRQELSWRLHFMMGALAYTLAGTDAWKLIAAIQPDAGRDDEMLVRRLTPFLLAGLQAPAPLVDEEPSLTPPAPYRSPTGLSPNASS